MRQTVHSTQAAQRGKSQQVKYVNGSSEGPQTSNQFFPNSTGGGASQQFVPMRTSGSLRKQFKIKTNYNSKHDSLEKKTLNDKLAMPENSGMSLMGIIRNYSNSSLERKNK